MVKVGDKVDITWTEALILSLDQGNDRCEPSWCGVVLAVAPAAAGAQPA